MMGQEIGRAWALAALLGKPQTLNHSDFGLVVRGVSWHLGSHACQFLWQELRRRKGDVFIQYSGARGQAKQGRKKAKQARCRHQKDCQVVVTCDKLNPSQASRFSILGIYEENSESMNLYFFTHILSLEFPFRAAGQWWSQQNLLIQRTNNTAIPNTLDHFLPYWSFEITDVTESTPKFSFFCYTNERYNIISQIIILFRIILT